MPDRGGKRQTTLWVSGRLTAVMDELTARGVKVSPALTKVLEGYVEVFFKKNPETWVSDCADRIQDIFKQSSEGGEKK